MSVLPLPRHLFLLLFVVSLCLGPEGCLQHVLRVLLGVLAMASCCCAVCNWRSALWTLTLASARRRVADCAICHDDNRCCALYSIFDARWSIACVCGSSSSSSGATMLRPPSDDDASVESCLP